MKKIVLFGLAASLAFVSCKEETTSTNDSFPTDNLTVDKQQNVFLLEKTGAWCQYCPNGAEKVKIEVNTHGERVIAMAAHEGDDLEVLAGTTLVSNFLDSAGYPTILVMNENVGQDPANAVLAALTPMELPYFGVKHTVETTDSSYNVYAKVEVLNEITEQDFFIQSYLLLDGVVAKDYGNGIDLNQVSSVPIVTEGSGTTPSKWALDAAIVNGEPTVKAGDVYEHEEVIYGVGMNTPDIWGFPLGLINPFGKEYLEGDIMGTKYTPIVVSIPLVDITPYESTLSVATIIWKYRLDGSGFYDYINGYVSHIN